MNGFVGTRALIRLALRRDRVMLPIWLVAFLVTAAGSAGAVKGLYPNREAITAASNSFNNAQSLVALYGRIYDTSSPAGIGLVKLGGLGGVFVALLSIILVMRHTRAEEEAGRQELVGAGVVGRRAPLTGALLTAFGTNVILAVITALGLVAAGLPADGSLAFGVAWGCVGIAFAAIAAVTAQLTTTSRAGTSLAVAILGVVYVFRAIGDTASASGPQWVTWLSPIGWGQQFRPYAGNRWWVALLMLGFAVVVTGAAYALVARRDYGAGLLAERPGRATAAPALRGPFALAWRLQRGALIGWAVGFALLGLVLGNIASNLGDFLTTSQAQDMITRLGGAKGLTDAYLAAVLGFAGVATSAYGIQAANRLRTEETSGHLESILATGVSRTRFVWSHTLVALLGTAFLLAVTGVSAGLAYGARVGMGQVGRMVAGALVQLPATCVLTAIVVLAFGVVPRFAAAGWAALAAFVLLGEIGPVVQLNHWVLDVSPYAHTPKLPGSPMAWTPVVVLTLVAVLLAATGFAGVRRRDVPVS